ncbi:MAG: hypothetical protein K2O15_10360 [Lachnospiraceae bacterium]|nr:hypothetical protein [Lachnospiraceae bacterium]
MRTVRKMLGFMLAVGLMVSAMAVFAAEGDAAGESTVTTPVESDYSLGKVTDYGNLKQYVGGKPGEGDNMKKGDFWYDPSRSLSYVWNGSSWELTESSGGSSSGSDSDSKSAVEKEAEARAEAEAAVERAIQEQASRDAVILAGAAMDEGFADMGDMYIASQKSMSAGEFYNNAVVSTPGIENAVTVGQGGNLVVNGQVTNMSATITKVTNRAYVDSVRIEQEGRVLNVVDVSYPATEATINFYMPGITGEENIVALQYNAGTWVNVEIAEVRADHVTLNMKGNGVVAFVAQ